MSRYAFRFDQVTPWLPYLVSGIRYTLVVSLLSMLVGIVLGMLAMSARLSRWRPLSAAATAYIEFFRATPGFTQLIWIYYVLPFVSGVTLPPLQVAVAALGLNMGAFMAETFRAGVLSVPKGHTEAALSVGMYPLEAFRRIVLPQAIVYSAAPVITLWVGLFKDSAMISTIGVAEMTYRAQVGSLVTFRPLEFYTVLAILYLALALPQARVADKVHEWLRVKD